MGLSLPAIILNRWPVKHPQHGFQDIVIDGQQRLRATAEFIQGDFPVRGEFFPDQDISFRRSFTMIDGPCPLIITKFQTEKECAELYVKLLTAGTAHTKEEIEKAKKIAESL